MSSEQAIIHWVNYHLKKANHKKTITNLTSDITDSESYAVLLRRIAPDRVSAGMTCVCRSCEDGARLRMYFKKKCLFLTLVIFFFAQMKLKRS